MLDITAVDPPPIADAVVFRDGQMTPFVSMPDLVVDVLAGAWERARA